MHSLLLQTEPNPNWTASLSKAGKNVHRLLAKHSSEALTQEYIEVSGLQGWCIQPSNDAFKLIEYRESRLTSIVFFGYLLKLSGPAIVGYIEQTYLKQGITAVCALEGVFSCIIFDKIERKYWVASDHIGHRKLKVAAGEKGILLSSHDATLLATDIPEFQIDSQRIRWASRLGWSLGGASFARGIIGAPPLGYLEITGNTIYERPGQLGLEHQLSSIDNTSEICEQLMNYTRGFCKETSEIQCDLTCGVDSRAVLGTAKSIGVAKSKLLVSTVGSPESEDVQIAQKITSRYGFHHKIIPTPFQLESAEKIWDRAKLKAFLSNGDSNFKRSLTSIPTALSHKWLTGEGGGIYKGFYFPIAPKRKGFDWEQAVSLLRKKIHRSSAFDSESTDFNTALDSHMEKLYETVPDAHAMLTAFFATDYIGVMGAIVSRFSWFPFKGSPFLSNEAFRTSLQCKPDILKKKSTHRLLLKRHMNKVRTIPINGLPGIFTFNHKLRQRVGRLFERQVTTHETEKRQLLIQILRGEIGAYLLEPSHANIWSEPSKLQDLLHNRRAFNQTDKLMMACAFQELVQDLKA